MMVKLHLVIFGALIYFQGVFMGQYNSSHYLGTHVDLECEAITPVDCIWKFNDAAIYMYMYTDGNYHYAFSNGSATTDCTLQISMFHKDDVGIWTCWSFATDESDGQLLNSYQLTLKDDQMDDAKNSSRFTIAVKNGWAVVLECTFDSVLEECHWLRNAEPVMISNRYKFVNFKRTGSDCSINITSIENIDLGSWQCTSSANNIFGYRSSHIAWLISQKPNGHHVISVNLPTVSRNYVTEHPRAISANFGDTAILQCQFKEPVYCVWLRKGKPIHVDHHHYYYAANDTIVSKTNDCTLTISHLILNDFGRWSCVGAAQDSSYAIESISASISQKRNYNNPSVMYTITRYEKSYIALGENVTLYCTSPGTGYCDWTRNGHSTKISSRYSFAHKYGMPTKDCTIQISTAKYIDAGNWSCSYMQYSASPNPQRVYEDTTLYVTPKPVLTMNNRYLYSKDNISKEDLENSKNTLLCTVETRNQPPTLKWMISNEVIPGEYKYVKVGDNVYLGNLYWSAKSMINVILPNNYEGTHLLSGNSVMLVCEFDFSINRKETVAVQILRKSSSHPAPVISKLSQTSYQPSKIHLIIGDNVTLNCTFNKLVNCTWKLNNTIVINSSVYKYLDSSEGQDTTNCSILVNFTEAMVNSTWQCSNIPVSINDSARSNPSTLSVMETPATPVIKWRYIVVNKLFYPELKIQYESSAYGYSYSNRLTCSTGYVYRSPNMQWEANGIIIMEQRTNEILLYSSVINRLIKMKNVTQLRCVMHHPTLKSPKYAVVKLEHYKPPNHPVIIINNAITKTNVTIPVNDKTKDILCVCQNGYPSANLSWILDGQKLFQPVYYHKVGAFQYTSTLPWQVPERKLFKKSTQLKCVAEHPGWDNPVVALANITLAYSPLKDRLQLLNENRVMQMKDSFVFHCIFSQPINCSMTINNTIVKEISPVSTVPSNDLIEGHIVEQCYIKLPPFGMQYVGVWQCTGEVSNGKIVRSNEVYLTSFEIPLKPRIEMDEHEGFYMNENRNEIILKSAKEKLKLKCIVQRSNPVSTLRWVVNGNSIISTSNITTTKTNFYLHDSILRWDSALNFTQVNDSAVLQCIAFFPTSNMIFDKAEITISIQRGPSKPLIFFNEKIINGKVDVPQLKDFNGFKCISENGNPAAKLHWLVNGQGISGQYENILVANRTYTAKLHWDRKNNDFLAEGSIKLACVVIHPSLHSPIIIGIQVTINTRKDVGTRENGILITPLTTQTEMPSAFHYFGIALLSTFTIIVAILTAIIYIRIRMKRSSGGSSNIDVGNLFSCIKRKQSPKDSPLIKYEHCEGQSDCQAIIISTTSEN